MAVCFNYDEIYVVELTTSYLYLVERYVFQPATCNLQPATCNQELGTPMDDLLRDYPVVIDIPIAWGEMDALQHVNNIVYFRYFESVRVAYLEKIGFISIADTAGIGPILAATNCRYKFPLTYPDRIRVGARTDRVEEDRFFMKYAVVSGRHGKVAAEGEAEIVAYDYRNLVKAAIPEDVAARIAEVENG
jgi:acyl-CoA thioester hydrolase